MSRLNNRAFEILRVEVFKCSGNDIAGKVQRDIALKRLEKLRMQNGSPATFAELRQTVSDILPNFNEKVLKEAANANKPKGMFGLLMFATVSVAGAAGFIWVANLPFPMIRKPVASVAPLILLPSYIKMDNDYRQAISLVEQADQLVNKASGPADINLGAEKVTKAQKHLNGLPVWFLGYEPKFYCSFFGCSWKFTYDEFEKARKQIGRMEATIFQEKNAQTLLSQAEEGLNAAKQQYQQAKPGADQQKAIAAWQVSIDQMGEIPESTLANLMARKKLQAAQRDFAEVVGDTAGRQRTNTLIEAAKTFAMAAAESSQNPPHSADEWGQIADLWEQAIHQLKLVPLQDSGYTDAVGKIAQYQKNLGIVTTRQKAEQESVEALQRAKRSIPNLQRLASAETESGAIAGQLQEIITDLENVKTGTTAYSEAQDLLKFAREKLK